MPDRALPAPHLPRTHPRNTPITPAPHLPGQEPVMGWGSALHADRLLRAVGGVTRYGRHAHPEGGYSYSVTWWYRGSRYQWCDHRAWERWICAIAGRPVPAWAAETAPQTVAS